MPAAKAAMKKPAKTTAKKPVKKVTLDDVWAGFAEIQKNHKEFEKSNARIQKYHEESEKSNAEFRKNTVEFQKVHEKRMAELWALHRETEEAHKETEKTLSKAVEDLNRGHRELQEGNKEIQKSLKETQKLVGGLSNTMGSLVEHIMTPDLPGKFKQFGFTFGRITTVKWAAEGSIYTEIDGLLENGSQAMVVEVKTTLRRGDIDDHLERMERVRKYADDHDDRREFLGAMAAMIIDKDTKQYALSKGFFVIEPSGEDVKVTKPVSEPKVW